MVLLYPERQFGDLTSHLLPRDDVLWLEMKKIPLNKSVLISGLLFHEISGHSLIAIHSALLLSECELSHNMSSLSGRIQSSIRNNGAWIVVYYLFAHYLYFLCNYLLHLSLSSFSSQEDYLEKFHMKGKEWKMLL